MSSNSSKVQQTTSGQLTITVPIAIAKLKGWTKGVELEFVDINGQTVLRRK